MSAAHKITTRGYWITTSANKTARRTLHPLSVPVPTEALPTVEQLEAELGATVQRIEHSEPPKPKKPGRKKKDGGE